MAEQIAIMHEAGSIPGIPGTFPGGCMVKYDDHTREVLEVKPLGYVEVVQVVEMPAPAPVETPQEASAQEASAQDPSVPVEAPAQDPSAPVEAPAQVEVNP